MLAHGNVGVGGAHCSVWLRAPHTGASVTCFKCPAHTSDERTYGVYKYLIFVLVLRTFIAVVCVKSQNGFCIWSFHVFLSNSFYLTKLDIHEC